MSVRFPCRAREAGSVFVCVSQRERGRKACVCERERDAAREIGEVKIRFDGVGCMAAANMARILPTV